MQADIKTNFARVKNPFKNVLITKIIIRSIQQEIVMQSYRIMFPEIIILKYIQAYVYMYQH